jgi:DNA-directed RNA polymerase specialized sigma24 family protein
MIREAVDFHFVPAHQEAIHMRLINWARAQRNGSGSSTAPMFRQYRSSDQWAQATVTSPIDQRDAARINKAWQQLPPKHRASLAWHYITPGSPQKACRQIGCTMAELAALVVDARTILINRRA